MKLYKSILSTVLTVAALGSLGSCSNDFDYPPVIMPEGGLGGNGSAAAPLNVNGVIAYYTAYYSDVPDAGTSYWATGFIVGCVQTTETVFVANDQTVNMTGNFTSPNNILLAANPDETDYENCIALQLPSGNVRSALNLVDNPANRGKQVTVYAYIDKYLGLPGMRSVEAFNWGAEGLPGYQTTKTDFAISKTITSGRAYALVAGKNAGQTLGPDVTNGFLKGASVTISDGKFTGEESLGFLFSETEAGSGNYYLTDYLGRFLFQDTYGSGWSNRPSVSKTLKPINSYLWKPVPNDDGTWTITNVGSSWILEYDSEYNSYGLYSTSDAARLHPTLYEMAADPTIPDFTPGDDNPDQPSGGDIYTGLVDNFDGWTIENVKLADGLTDVWSWAEYNGSHYLNGSAYVDGKSLEAEAYAFTTVDLAGVAKASVSFSHAAKFQTTLKTLCGMIIRENGSTAWTSLTIPSWPEKGAWTFVSSGDIDLTAFAGKKVDIGFRYGGSSEGADTWEIKNLIIKGSK